MINLSTTTWPVPARRGTSNEIGAATQRLHRLRGRADTDIRWRAVHALSPDSEAMPQECELLFGMVSNAYTAHPRQVLCQAGRSYDHALILLNGWAQRYSILQDGRKQILNFLLPTDITGLEHCLTGVAPRTVEAITECRVARVPVALLLGLLQEHPQIAGGVLRRGSLEASIAQERLVSLGRRTALEAMMHLLLEIDARLAAIGLSAGSYPLPLTQAHIGDALGLSSIHVCRTFHALRRMELVAFEGGRLEILNRAEAERIADFSPDYLLPHRPSDDVPTGAPPQGDDAS